MKESIGAGMTKKGQRATLLLFLVSLFAREFIRDPTRASVLRAHTR